MRKIYGNGTILTMEGGHEAEAVLTEDGLILKTGTRRELSEQAAKAEYVDLKGATMLPAFLDTHSHFFAAANAMLQVSLEDTVTLEDIEERIHHFIKENRLEKESWIIAKGYDHNILPEAKHPPLSFLDQIAPEHLLVLQHKSGHMGLFNSRVLKTFDITEETLAPQGGLIGKENGKLTGYMEENAFLFYQQKIPMPNAETLLKACDSVQNKYASHGITTVQEGMMVNQILPIYRQLTKSGMLKLDIIGYPDQNSIGTYINTFPQSIKKYHGHFKIGGLKIFLDGSPQGRTAWMRTPYEHDNHYYGYGTMTDSEVFDALKQSGELKIQLLAHCNGDRAAQQYIDAVQKAMNRGYALRRPVMIHAQLLGTDQLKQLQACGIIPSYFAAHIYHWGDTHIKNFGRKRAEKISPLASSLNRGIPFTLHQDTPVIEPDMLESVWCAVVRRTKNGQILGAEERIDVKEALKAITINAAYQYFEEDTKGSIRPGKNADFVVLSQNPLKIPPDHIRDIQILATIKRDEFIYQK